MQLFRRVTDPNIWLIYLSILLVGTASGVGISLLGIHLDDRGMDEGTIGVLAAWGATGIILASLGMGALMAKVSAKSTLVLSLLVFTVTVAVLPFVTHSVAWTAFVRVIDGAAAAGIWISSETILLSRASKDAKATVTSLYAAAISIGYILGSLLAGQVVAIKQRAHLMPTPLIDNAFDWLICL